MRNRIIVLTLVAIIQFVSYDFSRAHQMGIIGQIGAPKGYLDWTLNGSWFLEPDINFPIKPELRYHGSFSLKKNIDYSGSIFLFTSSAYLLAKYESEIGETNIYPFLAVGAGLHNLSSHSTAKSRLGTMTKVKYAAKGHVFAGINYKYPSGYFINFSLRSSFPDEFIIDSGYLGIGKYLESSKSDNDIGFNSRYSDENSGMFIIFRTGAAFGITNQYFNIYNSSVIGGIWLSRHFTVGAGAGLESADNVLMVPVFADLRYHINNATLSPYFVAEGGYSFSYYYPTTRKYSPAWYDQSFLSKGGWLANIGVGTSIIRNRKCNVAIEASFGYQGNIRPTKSHGTAYNYDGNMGHYHYDTYYYEDIAFGLFSLAFRF